MSTLRISDAPLLPDVNGAEKIPTGGRGDYAISVDQIKDHIFQDIGKELVGLGNVDNTSDLDKPVSTAQQAALNLKADKTYVDTNLNLKADKTNVYTRSETTLALSSKADLVGGVIPSDQLPSYVDDVVEYTTSTLPIIGDSGKIYITTDTNRTWRWSGNQYVEISNGGVSDSTLKLQTPRKIAGVDFDGTQNIDIPHNNLTNRNVASAHTADSISVASGGLTQQDINDFGVAKWRNKSGGYDLNSRVTLDNGDVVKSTVANNTANPNVDMTGWVNPLANLAKKTALNVDDFFVVGMVNWGVALQAAIDAANNAGGGRVFMPARVYDTSETIVMKSNVVLEGEFRGERGGLGGTVIRKNGDYTALRFGTLTTVRCDDFGAYNFSVDGNGFGGDGVSFEHCHYFDIDNLTSVRNTNGGRGFHFYYTWTGKIGQLFSIWNDISYRIFFQCNALDIEHLYSSTANGGAVGVHLQIGGLLGVNINLLTTEGAGRYHMQQLGYTKNLNIETWYCEFNNATAGVANMLYSNAADAAQENVAAQVNNIMVIANGVSTAIPIVFISNNHKGYVFKNAYIRLNGTADYSTIPVLKVNNSGANNEATGVVFDQIHIEDNTTGNTTSTYGVAFQGTKTPHCKAANITTTKTTLKNTWGGLDYDQRVDGRIGAQLTPISTVAPRYIGERFTATTKNRLYTANGLGLGDWARVDGAVELVDEPLFAAQGVWTLGAGWSVSGGDLVVNGAGLASQQLDIKAGKYYRVRFAVKDFTSGSVSVAVGGVSVSTVTANATFDQIIKATNFSALTLNAAASSSMKFDYFSVSESAAI